MGGTRQVVRWAVSILQLWVAVFLLVPAQLAAQSTTIDATVVDSTAPTLATVTLPTASIYNASSIPSTFTGQAADNVLGSGLGANSTSFTIQQSSSGQYWNGSAWSGSVTYLGTTHSGSNQADVVTWTSSTTLPSWSDGSYVVRARATDRGGNTFDGSTVTFTYDNTPPNPVSVVYDGSTDGVDVDTTTSTTSLQANWPDSTDETSGVDRYEYAVGTTPGGTDVRDYTDVGTETSITIDGINLTDGVTYYVSVRVVDEAGNISSTTSSDGIVAGTTSTAQPPVPPVVIFPTPGSSVDDPTPTITGTGDPGSTITVTIDGDDTEYTGTVGPDGNWTVTIDEPLDDGPHTVEVTQTNGNGTSDPTIFTFSVDTTPETPGTGIDPPVITSPDPGEAVPDPTPTITGTGDPGSTITVTIDGDDTEYTGTVGPDGNWTVTITTDLPPGTYTVDVTQTNDEGQTSEPTTITFRVGAEQPVVLSPNPGDTVFDPTPNVTGTGEPGATVTVHVEPTGNVYSTVVDSDGNWSLNILDPLEDGDYVLKVTQTINGYVSPPLEIPFSIDATIPLPAWLAGTINAITNVPGLPVVNTLLPVGLGVVTVSLALVPALFALPMGLPSTIPLMNLFAALFGWLKRRRKYGIIYDSVTRKPLAGATIRLLAEGGNGFEAGKLVGTQTSDERGQYTFTVEQGSYRIEVVAPDYRFPSTRATVDYRGEIVLARRNGLLHPDIPVDALIPEIHSHFLNFRVWGARIDTLRIPLMILGTLSAVVFFLERQAVLDTVILVGYLLFWILELVSYYQGREFAYVRSSGQPVSMAIVRLYDSVGRLLRTRVSNLEGRYALFADKGRYQLNTVKFGYHDTDQPVTMGRAGIISRNVALSGVEQRQ